MSEIRVAQEAPKVPTRDEIRAAFFSGKPKIKKVPLESGFTVDVRQPTVGEQLELSKLEDSEERILRMFVGHVFLENTQTAVFEKEDVAALREAPAQGDYSKIMEAITSVMGLDVAVKEATKN